MSLLPVQNKTTCTTPSALTPPPSPLASDTDASKISLAAQNSFESTLTAPSSLPGHHLPLLSYKKQPSAATSKRLWSRLGELLGAAAAKISLLNS